MNADMKLSMTERNERDKELTICPLIGLFYKECHCTNLTSLNIRSAIYYCAKNYEECDIYRGMVARNGAPDSELLNNEEA